MYNYFFKLLILFYGDEWNRVYKLSIKFCIVIIICIFSIFGLVGVN